MEPAPLRTTRFHQLIAEAVAEYEHLQSSSAELHEPGRWGESEGEWLRGASGEQALEAEPSWAPTPEESRGADAGPGAEERAAALNQGTASGRGICFAEQRERPQAFARDAADGLPAWDDEALPPPDGADGDSKAMKWWDFMVSIANFEGAFVLRECWQGRRSDHSDHDTAGSSFEVNPSPNKIGRPSFLRSLATRVQLSKSCSFLEDTDVVRMAWRERASETGFARLASSLSSTWSSGTLDGSWATRTMLRPYSMVRVTWVFFGMLFLLADVLVLSMTAFGVERTLWLDAVGAVYWSLDILANFRTGIYTKSGLEMDPRAIAKQYLARWFWIDLFLVVFQWLMVCLDRGSATSSIAGLRYVKTVRHLKLLRLVKFDFMVNEVLRRIQSVWALLAAKMTMCLLAVLMWVHLSATAWYSLGSMTEDGWARQMEELSTHSDSVFVHYLASLHWSAAQLQGNVDIHPNLPRERAFASAHLLASIVVLALLISKLTTVMQEMQEAKAAERRMLNIVQIYMKEHGISPELAFSVRTYIMRKQAIDAKHSYNRDELELFRVLPSGLRRAVLQEARGPVLLRHVLFSAFKRSHGRFFERLCCDLLRSLTVGPDDHIFSVAVLCLHVYFVVAGGTTYFAYTRSVAALLNGETGMSSTVDSGEWRDRQKKKSHNGVKEGACLCEPAIWVRWVHRGDFDATTQASLLLLDVNAFEELVSSYFTVKLAMQQHAARWVRQLNETESLTDLLSSLDALQECV